MVTRFEITLPLFRSVLSVVPGIAVFFCLRSASGMLYSLVSRLHLALSGDGSEPQKGGKPSAGSCTLQRRLTPIPGMVSCRKRKPSYCELHLRTRPSLNLNCSLRSSLLFDVWLWAISAKFVHLCDGCMSTPHTQLCPDCCCVYCLQVLQPIFAIYRRYGIVVCF